MRISDWSSDVCSSDLCTSADDFQDARAVCDELDIPLHRVDFSREYRERVFARFLADYAAGKTPNPEVLCNREVKFAPFRSEEHTSELQSLMRISYAVFCLKQNTSCATKPKTHN